MATASKPVGKRAKKSKREREALNMRIRPELRRLIDEAAEATGKNRTDFVLDAARQAAEAALLDQVHIQLNPKAYADFIARLDVQPQPNEFLRKTMQTPPVWA